MFICFAEIQVDNYFKKKKYTKEDCIKNHFEDIKNHNIDIDDMEKYLILYDNNHKNTLVIGILDHENQKIVIKYFCIDDLEKIEDIIMEKSNYLFSKYNIDEINFDVDENCKNILIKNNIQLTIKK